MRRFSSNHLTPQLKRALIQLARTTQASTDVVAYLDARWTRYPEVCVSFDGEHVDAFALLHPFVTNGERHLYIGPVFSHGGAYLELIAAFVRAELASRRPFPFHLAAEVEHPSVLRSMGKLLPSHAPTPMSPDTRSIASRFREHIPHIEGLDLTNLTTAVSDPLCTPYRESAPTAQLVIISCDASSECRAGLDRELRRGLTLVRRSAP